jgi:hypothetical protein
VKESSISIGGKRSPVDYAPTVDAQDAPPSGGRFETFDANARFVVVRDDDGYGVWRLEELGEGVPIQRFADDDAGYELAADMWAALTRADRRRRSPWLSILKWIVIVSVILWASAEIVSTAILYLNEFDAFREGPRDLSGFFEVMQVVTTIGYAITFGGTALYVVLWLDARRER